MRTVGELRAAGGALWKSIADDQRGQALTQLLDLLIRCGADDGVPVSEAVPQANGTEP